MSSTEQVMSCRVYALRAVGNQEYNVAFMLKARLSIRVLIRLGLPP